MTRLVQRTRRDMLAAAAICALKPLAFANDGAMQTIKLIVPFAAGGGADQPARLFAAKTAEQLGQPIVIENLAGAGGSIGAAAAARSPPDGLTLVYGTASTHGINASLYKKLPYDPLKDFAPIVSLASSANVLVARNDLGARTLPELIALAKRAPGKLTMGSPGIGTTPHMSGILLNKTAGIDTLHVPFKTTPILEVIAGRLDYSVEAIFSAIPFIRTGQVTAIAVTAPVRDPQLKDVPAVAESYPGYAVVTWSGFFAPAGTPAPIVKRINEATNRALKDPAFIATLAERGSQALGGTPQELQERVKSELARWPPIIKEFGISVD